MTSQGSHPPARACQRDVAKRLRSLRDKVVQAYGFKCYVPEFAGDACDRPRRDARVAKALEAAGAGIMKRCGTTFDQLGLSAGTTLAERIDALLNQVFIRAQHLAQRVYSPMNLGPTGLLGPHPVGVRTLELVDPSRPNPVGAQYRPLVTEVYYPSTAEAVAGVPRDVLDIAGAIIRTATYRDVARAPGTFPLVVYSHGFPSTRLDDVHLFTHLADYGFVVVSADHPGKQLHEPLRGPCIPDEPPARPALPHRPVPRLQRRGGQLPGRSDRSRPHRRQWLVNRRIRDHHARDRPFLPWHLHRSTDEGDVPARRGATLLGTDPPAIFGTITIPTLSLGGDSGFSVVLAPDLQACSTSSGRVPP